MSWINNGHSVTIPYIVVRKDWYIKRNYCLYLVQHSQKNSLCLENISFISVIMIIIISLNQHWIGSYLMHCRLNRSIYLKALSSNYVLFWGSYCWTRIFCFWRHFYLSRLNLTSSTNIELLTALCNVAQID